MRCTCGAVLALSGEIPNPIELRVIRSADLDAAGDDIDRVNLAASVAFECPTCRRLWIYWDGFDAEPMQYVREP